MNSNSQPNSSTNLPDSTQLFIVGIGASAGGLTALKAFFAKVPKDSGLAFVVVVHLAPDQDSHLADLLQPHCKIPAQQVSENTPIEPNQIYIIPPNANLDTVDTHLRLSKLEDKRLERAPIDHFFRTLAINHHENAVGVILTGSGSDGALGIKEIKGRGGLVVVQDPNDAEYDGMPQSTIATGAVDLVLPLDKIPDTILRFIRTTPRLAVPPEEVAPDHTTKQDDERKLLQKVFAHIRGQTGRDFSLYKPSTIMRRITRRMQLHQKEELSTYLELLREQPGEARSLADDLLITVTNFFRDPEVFKQLEKEYIPKLFDEKELEENIRIWSVGCATGEEAYSLAMLVIEEAARHSVFPSVQIFASDLHELSLKRAREGFYPGDITVDVSPERIRRFFEQEKGGYRIRKEVRDTVVFAPHNLMGDPPFSRLDLIICRNLLIYLQRNVQRDVIELFHYALRPGGYLLLGSSETIETTDLFLTEDKKICLYKKRNVPAPEPSLPVFPLISSRLSGEPPKNEVETGPIAYGSLHQQMVERYAPPSMLVSADNKAVHLSENVGRYLVHPGGEITANVFKLIREELRIELRAVLHAAREQKIMKRSKPIPITLDGHAAEVVLHLRASPEPQQQGFVLVIIDERIAAESRQPKENRKNLIDPSSRELEAELDITKHRLQTIVEEYETSQEEMKAANEEMQSTNEELRSTLEELETSKEELQSMNEELTMVNQENRHKVEELAQLTSDLQNLLTATDIATLFLDRNLRIMRFTPQVGELFNIRTTDRGRPLADLTSRLLDVDILTNARQVLNKLTPIVTEVQDEQDRWYLSRILPYRSTDDRIEGIVITFVDITERKQAEQDLRLSEEQFRTLVENSTQIVWKANANGLVVEDSPTWRAFTGQTLQEWTGMEGGVPGWIKAAHPDDQEKLIDYWHQTLRAESPSEITFRLSHHSGKWRWTNMKEVPLHNPDGSVRSWIGTNTDITEQKLAEEAMRVAREEAEKAARAKEDFLAHMSHEIRTPLNAILGLTNLLLGQGPTPAQLENLEILKFSADNLKMLVNDILDFSKIQAGKVAVERTEVNLQTLLHSLQKAHRPWANERNNQMKVQFDERIPERVLSDPLKLSQVLNNLISNALKFTENGLVTVDVQLHQQEKDRIWVTFSVQDTGIGISPDKLDTIFEVFTQADISTVRRYGGTGLGLSITKLLLELMGSRIEVESEADKGSRFFFTLPMQIGSAGTLHPSADTPSNSKVVSENLRILLVEDAALNRMVLSQFLEAWWSLTPDEATNGQEAIEMAKKASYDLILMDIRMPVMDGYQATQALRKLSDHYAQVPILALTADTAEEVSRHPEASLFQDVINKPFDPENLREKILQHAPDFNISASDATTSLSPNPPKAPSTAAGKSPTDSEPHALEEIFKGDEQKIRQYLENAVVELSDLKENYTQAINNQDQQQLSQEIHKTTMLLDILQLSELKGLLVESKALIENSANEKALAENRTKVEDQLTKVIAQLQSQKEQLND